MPPAKHWLYGALMTAGLMLGPILLALAFWLAGDAR